MSTAVGLRKCLFPAPYVGTRAVPASLTARCQPILCGATEAGTAPDLSHSVFNSPKSQGCFFAFQPPISTVFPSGSGRLLGSGWWPSSHAHILQLPHQEP